VSNPEVKSPGGPDRRTPKLSVVVPVYGCADCARELHRRIAAAVEPLVDSFEVVYIDDRSPDEAWPVLFAIASEDDRVRVVRLSRNFGQHAAITAGLSQARGHWTVVMDCDLQDPPEQIALLVEKAREGHDIVLGRRTQRSDSRLRRWAARAYFRLVNAFAGTSFNGEYGSFSLISSKVREAYLTLGDRHRHYLLVLFWLGFDPVSVDYEQAPRRTGRSAYRMGTLLRHALDGALFHTTALLRWIAFLGFGLAAAGGALALFLVVARVFQNFYPGWTSIMVAVLVLSGFLIASIGVTGLYVDKVFEQVKGRPLFVVDEIAGGYQREDP
jgi:polyisoprenyl-phosphate glycosyltransferase